MAELKTSAGYVPTGDQPRAIEELTRSLQAGERYQTLLGATGTGKTATMAWIIEQMQKPALVIAHNKTLAAQLCNEFREFFPANAVEYFVSYYDYYQPEAYVPQADLYIEKDSLAERRHRPAPPRGDLEPALAPRHRDRRVRLLHLRPRLAGGVREARRLPHRRRGDRPRRDAAEADRHPVRPQRHAARPRPLPGQGRRDRDPAGVLRDRLPRLDVRRRGRADHPLRPAHRRGLREARHDHRLPGDAVRHLEADDRARAGRDQARARAAGGAVREPGPDARGAPDPPAHRVRPGDDARARLLQRDRELLADPRRAAGGLGAAHAARLLPLRLRRLRRRVAPDDPADRRHVRGRPLAQADARRPRLPAPVRARQPAAPLRRVPRQGQPARLRLGDARPVRAAPLAGRLRAADPADLPRRPRGRAAADEEPDRRPPERDPPARGGGRARARDDADEEDVRGPDRLPARGRRPRALPPLRDRHARADPDHPRAAARRVRRARRDQPAPRGPRPARGLARRDPRRRQGGLPPRQDGARADDRPRRAQPQRPRAALRRQDDRGDQGRDGGDRAAPRDPARLQRGARDDADLDHEGRQRHRRVPLAREPERPRPAAARREGRGRGAVARGAGEARGHARGGDVRRRRGAALRVRRQAARRDQGAAARAAALAEPVS